MKQDLSITQVPGTQVIFDNYVGPNGFHRACDRALYELPSIELQPEKLIKVRDLEDAISAAEVKIQKNKEAR